MAHTHAPAPSTSVNPAAHQRRLIATLTVTGSVFLIEMVSAVLTGSLALLVDAGHMLTDMSVLAASTITAILMRRKPSNTRTWGWARLEAVSYTHLDVYKRQHSIHVAHPTDRAAW